MSKIQTLASKKLYDEGYWLDEEGRIIRIMSSEGQCFEIFFLGEEILSISHRGKTERVKKVLEITAREKKPLIRAEKNDGGIIDIML